MNHSTDGASKMCLLAGAAADIFSRRLLREKVCPRLVSNQLIPVYETRSGSNPRGHTLSVGAFYVQPLMQRKRRSIPMGAPATPVRPGRLLILM